MWELSKLPSHVHLLEDLLSRRHEDLDRILEEHHAIQAGGTFVMDPVSLRRLIPDFALETLRAHPHSAISASTTKEMPKAITTHVSYLAQTIHYVLTEKMPEFVDKERTDGSAVTVVADHVFQLDGAIKMLWENKSLKVFDAFVGRQLINEIKARRSGDPYPSCRQIHTTVTEL